MYRLGLGLSYPSIDAAIAKFEGTGPTTIATRNNNPGNLVYSPWMAQYGCTPGGAGGFAQCPTADAGQQILDYRVSQLVNQGDSISDLLYTWAGPQYPGNSQASYNNYVASVASQTGLDPNTPIAQQLAAGSDGGTLADAVTGGYSLPGSFDLPSLDLSSLADNSTLMWGAGIAAGLLLLMWASR